MKKYSAIWKRFYVSLFKNTFFRSLGAQIYFLLILVFFLIGTFGFLFPIVIAVYMILFYLLLSLFTVYKYIYAHRMIMKMYRKISAESSSFLFSYDDTGFKYDLGNQKMELSWKILKKQAITETEIYLFDENKRPLEIISRSLLSEEDFLAIKKLAAEKVPEVIRF